MFPSRSESQQERRRHQALARRCAHGNSNVVTATTARMSDLDGELCERRVRPTLESSRASPASAGIRRISALRDAQEVPASYAVVRGAYLLRRGGAFIWASAIWPSGSRPRLRHGIGPIATHQSPPQQALALVAVTVPDGPEFEPWRAPLCKRPSAIVPEARRRALLFFGSDVGLGAPEQRGCAPLLGGVWRRACAR
jgi:hypothetical protein